MSSNVVSKSGPIFGPEYERVVDQGADALGMSKAQRAVAKLGAKVQQLNQLSVAGGSARSTMAELAEQAARTELPSPAIAKQLGQGYAQTAASQSGQQAFKLDVEAVLSWIPQGAGFEALLGMRTQFDLKNDKPSALGMLGGKGAYAEFLAGQLRSNPALRQAFERDFGVKLETGIFAGNQEVVIQGGSKPTPGHLDPNILGYQKCLEVLLQNWEVFDTAVGVRDEYLTQDNLKAILTNPNASPLLKEAARFLVDHPEYFNRLEMAARVGGKDGIVGLGDVVGDLTRVKAELAKYGPPASGAPGQDRKEESIVSGGSGAGAPNPLRTILEDRSLSLEDKVERLLAQAMGSLDSQIEQTTRQLAAAHDPRNQAAGGQSSQDLQLKLQKLVERRKLMFELVSTMSVKFNEMAKTALANLARA